ncbi:DUF4113 domain-containing protein [Crenobacter sp. SG2305]|uniref:DUF4113 domain-containing protein n=1 Tax=Crenobacter oryzisoli TaxID=3056844 RepID=UPI0025AB382E|nr:DUF4113 domain-containing protein [Crenobacter sp. SG2305]MDN0081595.1 DUF4113 domain-containing protein [Crenobacter sp. SG2305]
MYVSFLTPSSSTIASHLNAEPPAKLANRVAAPPDPRRISLMAEMDRINRHYGRGTLRTGAEELTKGWRMLQDKHSPRYTTDWRELLVIR